MKCREKPDRSGLNRNSHPVFISVFINSDGITFVVGKNKDGLLYIYKDLCKVKAICLWKVKFGIV